MYDLSAYAGRRYAVNTPRSYLLLFVACAVCWAKGYADSLGFPVYGEVSASPLWNRICQLLSANVFLAYSMGSVLMVLGAFLIHRANYALVLIREKTLLPFFFYLLLVSTNPDFMPVRSTAVGVFCLILAIYQLFTAYHDERAAARLFNAGLILGVGSLLWIHLLWFMPLFWYGMYCFRALSARTFVAFLLGVMTIYWFLLGCCVWINEYTLLTQPFHALFRIRFLMIEPTGISGWIGIGMMAGMTLLASANIIMHEYEDNLRTRQFLYFLITLTLWIFLHFFLYEETSDETLEVACMPVAILLAHFFTVTRNRYVFWLFHLTVCLFVFLFFSRLLWNF